MEESTLQCEFCAHKSATKLEWKTHMSTQHDTTVYICDLCPKVYYSEAEYIQHFDAEHKSDYNRHTCTFCGVSYKWFKFLEKHIEKKHQVNKLKQCTKCGEEFYNTMAYQRHLKLAHASGRPFYKCGKCFRSFSARSFVSLHEKFDHHPNGVKYFREYALEKLSLESVDLLKDSRKCAECNLDFSSAMYLYKHFKLSHNKKKFYQCCKCKDAVYETRTGLSIHLYHEHNVSREHKCDECTKAYFKLPLNTKKDEGTVKTVNENDGLERIAVHTPSWADLYAKQEIPDDLELKDASEVEINNLRKNIKTLFHVLSTVPTSKLRGTVHSDLHVESVFSINKHKSNDRPRMHEIDTKIGKDDDNVTFLSKDVEVRKKSRKRKMVRDKKVRDKVNSVLTVIRVEDGNERFKCDLCHHEFSYKKGLKAHIVSRHGYNGMFKQINTKKDKTVKPKKSHLNESDRVETSKNYNVSLLVERRSSNDWTEYVSPENETGIDYTSDTVSEGMLEIILQKENKSTESHKDSETSLSDKCNLSQTDNAQVNGKKTSTPQKVKKTSSTQKSDKMEKLNKSITQKDEIKSYEDESSSNGQDDRKLKTKSETTQILNINKPKTIQKVNDCGTPEKVRKTDKKSDDTKKKNKSGSSSSVKETLGSLKNKKSHTNIKETQKLDEINIDKSEASQKINKSMEQKDNLHKKPETPVKVKISEKDENSSTPENAKKSFTKSDYVKMSEKSPDNNRSVTEKVNPLQENNNSSTLENVNKLDEKSDEIKKTVTPEASQINKPCCTNNIANGDKKSITSQTVAKVDASQEETPSNPSLVNNKDESICHFKRTRNEDKSDPLPNDNNSSTVKKVTIINNIKFNTTKTHTNSIKEQNLNQSNRSFTNEMSDTSNEVKHTGIPPKVKKSDSKNYATKKEKNLNTPPKDNKSETVPKVEKSDTTKSNATQKESKQKAEEKTETNQKIDKTDASIEINTQNISQIVKKSTDTTKENPATKYKCKFCQIELDDELLLLNHLTESHSSLEKQDGETIYYKCIECCIAFQQEDFLITHMLERHPNSDARSGTLPKTCEICNRSFSDKLQLKLHKLQTHRTKVNSRKRRNSKHSRLKLRNNSGKVTEKDEKQSKKKENSKIEDDDYEKIKEKLLKMCRKEINSRKMSQQEELNRIHKCLKCESKFPKRSTLHSHIKNKHKINIFKLHKCEMCNAVFKMADKLKQHIKMKHKTQTESNNLPIIRINKSKLSPIKLSNGKMPNILSNLMLLNGKMQTCKMCNSYFPTSDLLQRHIQWEHSTNVNLHKCGQCCQVLYNVEDLEMHMSTAHNSTDGIFKWKKQIAFNYEQQTDL